MKVIDTKGFSLIEVLISITLLGILMLGVYTMTTNSQATKDRILLEDQDFIQSITALNRIQIDFSQIYSPLYFSPKKITSSHNYNLHDHGNFTGATKDGYLIPKFFNPDKQTIIFITSANRRKIQDAKQSSLMWVQYTLRRQEYDPTSEDEEAKKIEGADFELIRLFSTNDIFAPTLNWDKTKKQVMLRNVKSLLFEFWDKQKEKWRDSLEHISNEEQETIRAVRVTLEWFDNAGSLHTNVRVMRPLWPYFNTKSLRSENQHR